MLAFIIYTDIIFSINYKINYPISKCYFINEF